MSLLITASVVIVCFLLSPLAKLKMNTQDLAPDLDLDLDVED